MLQSFLPELKQMADGTDLDDSGCLDRLHFKIPNFSLDKIGISFTNTGLLNIKINGLSPELSGRATKKILFVKVRKSFTVTLKNFRFDGNFKVGTKYVDGVRVPDLTFSGDPSINFTAKLDLGHSNNKYFLSHQIHFHILLILKLLIHLYPYLIVHLLFFV